MFGTLLTYLNDHETDVFVVVTANDISKLPPEFFRSERFDAVFMIDLPGRQGEERDLGNVSGQVRSGCSASPTGR